VTVKKVTRVLRVTSTKTVSVPASSGPVRAKRDYLDEPLLEPLYDDDLAVEDAVLEGRALEEEESASIEDEERSKEHDLETRQARNLCPVCPAGAVVSSGKTSGGSNIVYCCPAVKVGSRSRKSDRPNILTLFCKVITKTATRRVTSTRRKTVKTTRTVFRTQTVIFSDISGRLFCELPGTDLPTGQKCLFRLPLDDVDNNGVYNSPPDTPIANAQLLLVAVSSGASTSTILNRARAITCPSYAEFSTDAQGIYNTSLDAGVLPNNSAVGIIERGQPCDQYLAQFTSDASGNVANPDSQIPVPVSTTAAIPTTAAILTTKAPSTTNTAPTIRGSETTTAALETTRTTLETITADVSTSTQPLTPSTLAVPRPSSSTETSATETTICFPTSAAVVVFEHGEPVKRTIGDIRTGDLVQSVSPSGKLDWSTVYVILHRSEAEIKLTHLITAKATLKLSRYHMVPALVGGCGSDRSQAKWVPAGFLKVGDGIFAPLECTPILALDSSTERGFANPLTFSQSIVVEGVSATTWALQAGPTEIRPWFYENGDVTRLWRVVSQMMVELPFKALYLALRPVYLLFPWQSTRVAIDELLCWLSWKWLDLTVHQHEVHESRAIRRVKFLVFGVGFYAALFWMAKFALQRAVGGLRLVFGEKNAGGVKSKRE